MNKFLSLSILFLALFAFPGPAQAHGGGPESVVSFAGIVNWLHFVVTALWLGGIAFLGLVVMPSVSGTGQESRELLDVITIRFSHLVWWCIAGLALTGVLTTWMHVPSPQTFTDSTYGLILIAKLVIAVGLVVCNAVISLGPSHRSVGSKQVVLPAFPRRKQGNRGLIRGASRVSMVLALLMMISIAALVEFDRSPWNIGLNFLRLSALVVWLGATAFLPLVLVPSTAGLKTSLLSRVNPGLLHKFGQLAVISALVAVGATALTAFQRLGFSAHRWTEGYGIASALELVTLVTMAFVLWRSTRLTGAGLPLATSPGSHGADGGTSNAIKRATDASIANLVLGLGALLFSSLGAAVYSPRESSLSGQIPTAASAISVDLIEPLGYIVAAVLAVALIWYFGVVEGKVSNPECNEDVR